MSTSKKIINVALPVPLRKSFDYSVPDELITKAKVGVRVLVPFAGRKLYGLIIKLQENSDTPSDKLKQCIDIVDEQPIFDDKHIQMAEWISRYYFSPIGQVFDLMQTRVLRTGGGEVPKGEPVWRLTERGNSFSLDGFSRAKAKQRLLKHLKKHQIIDKFIANSIATSWRSIFKSFIELGIITKEIGEPAKIEIDGSELPKKLTCQQSTIYQKISAQTGYNANLVFGVTGSGKTEVYLSIIEKFIENKHQALILVPEIGLTPQLIERVKARLKVRVATVHSKLSDTERHLVWWQAKTHNVDVVLGTRSAVFTPFKSLAVIIVDEEHDLSFKQQDGVRYHARDVAVLRARDNDIPIIMGSATPALESIWNANSKRFNSFALTERATGMSMPSIGLVDVEACRTDSDFKRFGLSPKLIMEIESRLEKNEQSLLYINRRGFSPTVYCPECMHIACCERCNTHFTRHQSTQNMMTLRCHHCGYDESHSKVCTVCHKADMVPVGFGTQRIEEGIATLFPKARFIRVDRDALSGKGELDAALSKIRDGEVDIIVGTQLLTKGHDFPRVTLVGVLDADKGLFSTDFRAGERFFQQILQVSGRAGRHKPGEVLIQTQFKDNPIFNYLRSHDYKSFANNELNERQAFSYPPSAYMALLRVESVGRQDGMTFLIDLLKSLPRYKDVHISDPVPSPMEKLAGRYRVQLMIKSIERSALRHTLSLLIELINKSIYTKRVRWSLDIDPVDMY